MARGVRGERARAARFPHAIGDAGADPDSFARVGASELPGLIASDFTTRSFPDSTGRRNFRKSAIYSEYCRRIGIDHAVAMPLFVDGTTLVSFVLNRAGSDFADREVVLLDRLRGWLAAMYRNALALQRAADAMAQLREIAQAENWAVVHVDRRRHVRELSPMAHTMLAEAFPGTHPRPGATLPSPIDDWLRKGTGSAAPRLALTPLVLRAAKHCLTVRALPELGGDAAWLLLVRSESDVQPAPSGAEHLTPREREVLGWVAAGKSDRQIATIVGTSPRTVQKHLEHIYVKLGVENRTAAVMRAASIRLALPRASTRKKRIPTR